MSVQLNNRLRTIYENYPQNCDFGDLSFEYDQRLITRLPIYCLNNKILERFKVSSIRRSFDNLNYGINPRNSDFHYLPFDYDQKLITRLQIYNINDNIIERLNNI